MNQQSGDTSSVPLLDIRGLTTAFARQSGGSGAAAVARAVDTVSLTVRQGETLAVVGESGCGKTVLALSVLGLIPDPPGRVIGGEALFHGQDLLAMDEAQLQGVRGEHMAMIFQEPMTSLNPVFRVGEQVAEGYRLHKRATRAEAHERAVEMLGLVGIPNPRERANSYPHELSGGMRQRVMIAMALVNDPELLFADEPTTALDVTIQAQILDLMRRLQAEKGSGVMLITHDLGVVAETAHRVAVMYAGQVVEEAPAADLFAHPAHPYTQGLMASVPRLGVRRTLAPIPGMVPGIFDLPAGCRFRPRCAHAHARCQEIPPLFPTGTGSAARCWLCESSGAAAGARGPA
ncbi:peptide/nickel transport system ATP-binding protein [Humidesulfovibrio mexicanus]|uniref:Peptide/nickel transport system ATP-binding protein n=1 Tax=Humidesulfovibrio mexicanus TaxID=147047 RepID=A0A238ZC52_9BACT|nr:ABC transporter ATP-binding protein [Humidesulfovibrio mexicanus]SNR81095.1 peptide/nickel transport system ATP-binding protein [Humidesulfovibrio mexicanus]